MDERDTYLSIDLDYWCHTEKDWTARLFFKRVWALGLKVTVALHHHHLLQSINRIARQLRRVVNVDYHSDITEEDFPFELNEGTWANFVRRPEQMTFEWRYPKEGCLDGSTGYCHSYIDPFEIQCTRWRRVVRKEGIARIPWHRICAVGVCLSPGWLDNLWTVNYPVECLGLHEWYGRWSFCNGHRAPTDMDAENGTGIFRPRLISPRL